ncbi:TPA: O-antigen polymerase [Photobacterium damselae]
MEKKNISLFVFFIFYFLSYIMALPFVYLFEYNYGQYHDISFNSYISTLYYTLPFVFSVWLGYLFCSILKPIKVKDIYNRSLIPKNKKYFLFFAYLPCVISSIYLLFSKGITIGIGGYGDQLENNSGNGIFLLFLYSYAPVTLLYLILKGEFKKIDVLKTIFVFILFGSFLFLITGGSRNISIGGILSVVFLVLYHGRISKKLFFTICFFIMLLATSLAFVRYSNSFADSESYYYLLLYSLDSFSPIYSLTSIIHYFNSAQFYPVYFDNFFNQFYTFIPRAIWTDKPTLLMTNGKYITMHVLGLSGRFIVSPSIIGTSVIMFGIGFVIIGFFSGFILYINDRMINSCNVLFKSAGFILLPSVFLLSRENLEFFLYKMILILIPLFFVYGIYHFFIWLPGKKSLKK